MMDVGLIRDIAVALFGIAGLNGIASGVAAVLYVKAPQAGVAKRVMLSALVASANTLMLFATIALVEHDTASNAFPAVIGLLLVAVGSAVLAIPGALVVTRMLEKVTRVSDTFA